jgi:hypothetical protein
MKKQIVACDVKLLPKGIFPSGTIFAVRLHIGEDGKTDEIQPRDSIKGIGPAFVQVVPQLEKCRFAPYSMNGKVTAYKGDLEFVAP